MDDPRPAADHRKSFSLKGLIWSMEPVGRLPYVLTGLSLAVLKYLLDRGLLGRLIDDDWMPWDYLSPLFAAVETTPYQDSPGTALSWIALAAATLPFLFIGVSLSMRRAIDAGLHPMVGLLFFVPFVNYLLIVLLGIVGPKSVESVVAPGGSSGGLPTGRDRDAKAWLPMIGGLLVGLTMVFFAVIGLNSYGAGLFLGAPFASGAVTGFLSASHARSSMREAVFLGQMAMLGIGVTLIVVAFEGLICLLMALPLASLATGVGSMVGWVLGRRGEDAGGPRNSATILIVVLVAWPLLSAFEAQSLEPRVRPVSTSLLIDAPPEVVWRNVVSFGDLDEPKGISEWIFHTGIAYPVRARIDGHGVGAVRHCEFSTGSFVEPITVWDEPRHLAFDVIAQPAPMKELSPYRELEPVHLDDYLRSQRGEFRLERQPDGSTLLVGTTFYSVEVLPQLYWRLYSDFIIRAIHRRVLEHIGELSEA